MKEFYDQVPEASIELRLGFCCCCLLPANTWASGLGLLLSTVRCHLSRPRAVFWTGDWTCQAFHVITYLSVQCLKLCSAGQTVTLTHPFSSSSVTKDSRNATWRVSSFPLLLFWTALFYLLF